jgi:hypothetical protein
VLSALCRPALCLAPAAHSLGSAGRLGGPRLRAGRRTAPSGSPALLPACFRRAGALGIDTYENEDSLFFEDWSAFSPEERMKTWDRRWVTAPARGTARHGTAAPPAMAGSKRACRPWHLVCRRALKRRRRRPCRPPQVPAAAVLPAGHHHPALGLPDARGAAQHRQHHAGQPARVPGGQAAHKHGQAADLLAGSPPVRACGAGVRSGSMQ